MCRHHLDEISISRVYSITTNENTQSPNIILFEQFHNKWNTMDAIESAMNIHRMKNAISQNEKNEICQFVYHQLSLQKKGTRKEYVEFPQLVLLFLGTKDNFRIRAPGAMHRAKFMANTVIFFYSSFIFIFIFFCVCVCLFLLDQLDELIRFCIYVVKVYVKIWFTCTIAAQAPDNDLYLLTSLQEYRKIDREIADGVIQTFLNHT